MAPGNRKLTRQASTSEVSTLSGGCGLGDCLHSSRLAVALAYVWSGRA